ncbi:MAG TPA: hypothetical protein PKW35_01060 [Nannocystaceae bacterium]|nr:hypothetical protein [Nannocystaceae bacterium]
MRAGMLILGAVMAACGPRAGSETGLSGGGGEVNGMEDSSGGSSGSAGSGKATGSSGSTTGGEVSTGGGGATEGLKIDMGIPDVSGGPPVGCKGKIDFLFVISNEHGMDVLTDRVAEALPGFIETIEAKFADFDAHIMVVDADGMWGSPVSCPPGPACPDGQGCAAVEEPMYPCWAHYAPGALGACDNTLGAGVTFPAGKEASNYRCELSGGRRYMLSNEPNKKAAFECIASVGHSGGNHRAGWAAVSALQPDLVGPGGCNAGFLRSDALLVLTFITNSPDDSSPYNGYVWANKILMAKGGDQDAVVAVVVSNDEDMSDNVCGTKPIVPKYELTKMAETLDHALMVSPCEPSYVPPFAKAAEIVLDVCDVYVPQ